MMRQSSQQLEALGEERALSPPALRDRQRQTTGLVVLLAMFTYGYFYAPAAWNEVSRFDLVRSVVESGRFDIDDYRENTGDKSFYNGHYYSDKAPGSAFLAVPSYAVYLAFLRLARRELPDQQYDSDLNLTATNRAFRSAMFVCSFFSVTLIGVLGLGVFYRLALRIAVDETAALLATLSFGFGTLAFPYATMLYGHQLCGCLLLVAFALLFTQRQSGHWNGWRVALSGCVACYAVVTEYTAALAALALAVYLLVMARSVRRLLQFAAGALPPALMLAVYNTVCFGRPWATGYGHVADPLFAEGMSRGLMGITYPRPAVLFALLFGTWRGFAWSCPVIFVGFIGLYRLFKDRWRAEALLCGALVTYLLLLNASYYMWWGGSASGPRHAVPMLPFLMLGLARLQRGAVRTVAWALLVYSSAVMVAVTAVGPEPPEDFDPLFRYYWFHMQSNHVAVNSGSSNLGLRMGLTGVASLVPLLIIWCVAAATLYRSHRAVRA